MLLPTPPFPERTNILCLMDLSFSLMILMAGLMTTSPEAHKV